MHRMTFYTSCLLNCRCLLAFVSKKSRPRCGSCGCFRRVLNLLSPKKKKKNKNKKIKNKTFFLSGRTWVVQSSWVVIKSGTIWSKISFCKKPIAFDKTRHDIRIGDNVSCYQIHQSMRDNILLCWHGDYGRQAWESRIMLIFLASYHMLLIAEARLSLIKKSITDSSQKFLSCVEGSWWW